MDDGQPAARVIPARFRAPGMAPWQQNLYVLWFGSLVVSTSFSLVMPFLPFYMVEDLGLRQDPSLWNGIVLSGAFLGTAVMAPVWGSLADRFGQRSMLLRSGFSLAVIYALMGLATAPWQLAALRVLFGMLSGFIPAATALVAANTPTFALGGALGSLQTGSAVGGVLGPLAGGVVAHVAGYRGAFFISAVCLAVAAVLAQLFVGEQVRGTSGRSVGEVVRGLVRLVRRPELGSAYTVLFLMQVGLMIAAPVLPIVIADRTDHASDVVVGFIFSLAGIAQMAASPFTARLAGRSSYRVVLASSLVAGGLLMIPQAFAGVAWLAAARLAFGVFLAWATVSVTILVARAAPEDSRGQAFGVLNSVTSLGNMVATLAGGVMGKALGLSWPILASGVLMIAAGALAVTLAARGSLQE